MPNFNDISIKELLEIDELPIIEELEENPNEVIEEKELLEEEIRIFHKPIASDTYGVTTAEFHHYKYKKNKEIKDFEELTKDGYTFKKR
jgi:hypothetical protein